MEKERMQAICESKEKEVSAAVIRQAEIEQYFKHALRSIEEAAKEDKAEQSLNLRISKLSQENNKLTLANKELEGKIKFAEERLTINAREANEKVRGLKNCIAALKNGLLDQLHARLSISAKELRESYNKFRQLQNGLVKEVIIQAKASVSKLIFELQKDHTLLCKEVKLYKEQANKECNKALYLSEQLRLLRDSTKDNLLSILKEKNNSSKDELFRLQFELKDTKQDLIRTMNLLHIAETGSKVLKQKLFDISQEIQEYKNKNDSLEAQLKNTQGQLSVRKHEHANRELILNEEVKALKQDVDQLRQENSRLVEENAALVGHTNTSQKIHILQKLKEESNNLRGENYHLKENVKAMTLKLEQQIGNNKELQIKYSKQHQTLLEMREKELSVLARLNMEAVSSGAGSLNNAEPIIQIEHTINRLLELIRARHL